MIRKTSRPRRADRRGFTLVELMVTVFLLSVAITGLVGTSGAVSRMMGGSVREASAAALASSRFETLRGSQCSGIVSGTQTTRGTTEKWVVTTINAKTFDVTDSVTFVPFGRKAAVKQAYRSYVKC
jgi:prepilin-type N-terminal cleavage/methylation domain-containing protein